MFRKQKNRGNNNIQAGRDIYINNGMISFCDFLERLPNERQPYSRFSYDAKNVEFFGRKDEIEKLIDFCLDMRKILWWAVTGAGGTGKSRLAYEFSKKIQEGKIERINDNWYIKNIKWPTFIKSIDFKSAWYFNKNIFLIIDYVHAYEVQIGQWISWLEQTSGNFLGKLRILLIERDTQKINSVDGKILNPVWFDFLYEGFSEDHEVWSMCYNNKFMSLNSIDREAAEGIICSYCHSIANRTVPYYIIQLIIAHTENLYNKKISPLYLQCFADAWLNNNDISNWDKDDIFQYLIQRETKRILQTLNQNQYKDEILRLFVISTIISDLDLGVPFINDLRMIRWLSISEEKLNELITILLNSSLLYSKKLKGIEPDLIGEYFVLQNLIKINDKKLFRDMFGLLYSHYESETLRFLVRFLSDYAMDLKMLGIYDYLQSLIGEERKNIFTVVDDMNIKHTCEVLFTFESDETGSNYIVYTDNTQDEDFNTRVYASTYNPETQTTMLGPIESEEEWKVIETILDELQSHDDIENKDIDELATQISERCLKL